MLATDAVNPCPLQGHGWAPRRMPTGWVDRLIHALFWLVPAGIRAAFFVLDAQHKPLGLFLALPLPLPRLPFLQLFDAFPV